MALHKSAKKRIVQTEKRTEINKDRRSRIRTFIKKVIVAVKTGNYEAATEAFKIAQPEIQRGANKSLFHKKTASRLVSRLSARVKSIKA